MWSTARQLANQHLSNPQYYVDDQVQWDFDEDVLIFSTFYDVNEENENYSTFAKNLREELIKIIHLLSNRPPPIRGNLTEGEKVDG